MLLIHVRGHGVDVHREWFDGGAINHQVANIWVGEGGEIDVPGIRGTATSLEQWSGGEVHVRSEYEFRIDGAIAKNQAVLGPGQQLTFEGYTLSFTKTEPLGRAQLEKIFALKRNPEAWKVYADQQEESGHVALAQWMRAERAVTEGTRETLRALGASVMPADRAMVATAKIYACYKGTACPGRWDALTPTPEPRFRICAPCKKRIPYCVDIDEAEPFAERSRPTAIDAGAWPPDEQWPHYPVG